MKAALICPVREVAGAIERHRARLDTSSVLGVPAHVTVLFPFATPVELGGDELGRLADAVASVSAFTAEFVSVGWFGEEVTWLRCSDDTGFRSLTEAVHRAFPDHPPYGGAHEDALPHLTVGTSPPGSLTALRAAAADAEHALPISTRVAEVHYGVFDDSPGSWRIVHRFPLAHRHDDRH